MKRSVNSTAITAAILVMFNIFFISFPIVSSAGDDASTATTNSTESLCSHLIQPSGYICAEHTVRTKDGFLLGLQRVSSNKANLKGTRRPPVLLLHGLFMGGDAWFLNGVDQSLGFILADQGFDVWVANERGTKWSHGHVVFSKLDKEFWNWSWQELATVDLPEMLHHVNNITNSKVSVVGHSQGTLMSLAAFTKTETANIVDATALLCPIAYMRRVTAPLVNLMVLLHADDLAIDEGINSIDLKRDFGASWVDNLCSIGAVCTNLLTSLAGENCCIDHSKVKRFLEFEPQPTSTKNLHHFAQMMRTGYFTRYDYGIADNINKYQRFNPPSFNLSVIPSSLPMWIGYGGNDELADISDVEHAMRELQTKTKNKLYLANYGHIDFLLSSTAKADVYDSLITFLKNH